MSIKHLIFREIGEFLDPVRIYFIFHSIFLRRLGNRSQITSFFFYLNRTKNKITIKLRRMLTPNNKIIIYDPPSHIKSAILQC